MFSQASYTWADLLLFTRGAEVWLPVTVLLLGSVGKVKAFFFFPCWNHLEDFSKSLYLFSLAFSNPVRPFACSCVLSHFRHAWLFVTLWTAARQAPLSMGFSRQEYWSGLPCSPPGNPRDPRAQTHISCVSCIAGGFFTQPPGKSTYLLQALFIVLGVGVNKQFCEALVFNEICLSYLEEIFLYISLWK